MNFSIKLQQVIFAIAVALIALACLPFVRAQEKIPETSIPPAKEIVPTPNPPPASPDAPNPVVTPAPTVAVSQWSDLKDLTYDQRTQLFAGLDALLARVDDQITELTAKRAAMPSNADTRDWDFRMKEMSEARTLLRSTAKDLARTTPEYWQQQKDKVADAWTRTQDAYSRVKQSTTR